MEQPSIRSAHELMTLITHEQSLIVNRLHSGDMEGIHEFIMEHALASRKYLMELVVLMGREQANNTWNRILHYVYDLNDSEDFLMSWSTESNLRPTQRRS
ncbi:MAG: hypothetical protein ACR2H5_09385 [Ktedonobacteraceae bacterium]